jgi:eukaryotic-like serine/threonine-protein kinase
MMKPPISREVMEQLLLGKLPSEQIEALANQLEQSDSWIGLFPETMPQDDLVGLVRSSATSQTAEDTARLQDLLGQVSKLHSQLPPGETALSGEPSPKVNSGEVRLLFQSPPLSPGELGRLGDYRVLNLLDQGGMGLVFLAEDLRLGRRVALKVMKPTVAANEECRLRFLREARAAAAVEDDHIVPIYQVGEEIGIPYLAMPLLKGETLRQRLRRGRLSVPELLRLGRQVAQGLAAAHAHGLIHRDIKPDNVWLEAGPENRVKILDFGLALLSREQGHLTQSGLVVGTPAYMAPEQARGQPLDARADLFSFGCLLYEAATGKSPFAKKDMMATLSSLAIDAPDEPRTLNPELPPALVEFMGRLLEKDPARRLSSAAEAVAILKALEQPGPAALETSLKQKLRGSFRFWREHPRQVWGLVLLVWLLLCGTWAVQKLIYETPQGNLVVDIDDPEVEARFRNGELRLYDNAGRLKYTIKPGERNKDLPQGHYAIEVVGADGVKLDTPRFEMFKDGKVIVRVILEPKTAAKDVDRRAAEWVLSIGGQVKVDVNGKESEVVVVEELPNSPFRLRSVNLAHHSHVSNGELVLLKGLKHLTTLDLGETRVSDEGLVHLANLTSLQVLRLFGTKVTCSGVKHLAGLTELRELSLGKTPLNETQLVHLQQFPKLDHIGLGWTRISDAGMVHLRKPTRLTSLYIAFTAIGDPGLAHLKEQTQLRELNLFGTRVTDNSLEVLLALKNLQLLELRKTAITPDAVRKLVAALPACSITSEHGNFGPKK